MIYLHLTDTKSQSFRWIAMVLENLIECYTHFEKEGEEHQTSSKPSDAAEKVLAELYEWHRTSTKQTDLMNSIHQEPSKTLHQFLHDSTKFQEATNLIQGLIHTQTKAKNQMSMQEPTILNKAQSEN